MNKYTNIHIDEHWKEPQANTSYLLLTELHHTPPHCSIIINQNWFSLNYNNCKNQIAFDILLKTLQKKQIPSLFLELSTPLDTSVAISIFNTYDKVNFQKKITCITPIKQIFNHHHMNCPPNLLLFELIDWLYKHQHITKTSALFFEPKNYVLNHYTQEILNSINYVKTK